MQLFNTMTGQLETVGNGDDPIGIYVCGITPYDTTHLGHAFTYAAFDVLVRLLRRQGRQVTYVQNVTDIDDDVLRKSKELGTKWDQLGREQTDIFLRDMEQINITPPDHFVKATDHITEMVALIEPLIEQNLAYVSSGSVYFSVAADPEFGKLSHLAPEEMLPVANERGNNPDDPDKRDPLDFVLWQAAKPGEPTWESPWGLGRPGWHIECSAMATRYLGPTIDVHGGGSDLIFPHHECEIAQTENSTGVEPFVKIWAHVGMVRYQDEKMSKSLGNLVRVGELLERFHPDAVRLCLHANHYRESWEYFGDQIERWSEVADLLQEAVEFTAYGIDDILDVSSERDRFLNALDDDLNTPAAIAALQDISQAILEAPDEDDVREAQATLSELGDLLGLTLNRY